MTDSLQARYARRGPPDRYGLLQPDVWQLVQERQRQILRGLEARGWQPERLQVTEVGCGAGGNLLEWLRAGCLPEQLTGCELLPERLAMSRRVLPAALALHGGDAALAPIAEASQDIVMQATVFSSILDESEQARLADAMWRWLRPGGAVLWYDFTMDNPRNPDVRGVPLARVRLLFPQAHVDAQRITLAPPLARRACALHPSLYPLLNAMPWLRSHCLAWLTKP
jgi:SAM-dependent methyltransferase